MLEQERACYADKCLQAVHKTVKQQEQYLMAVRKVPPMIMVNGLGQTVAFLLEKGRKEVAYYLVYEHLSYWIIQKRRIYQGGSDLLSLIKQGNREAYLEAQDEALALLVWLKRLAGALFETDGEVSG